MERGRLDKIVTIQIHFLNCHNICHDNLFAIEQMPFVHYILVRVSTANGQTRLNAYNFVILWKNYW